MATSNSIDILFSEDNQGIMLLCVPALLALFSAILFVLRKMSRKVINLLLAFFLLIVSIPALFFIEKGLTATFNQSFTWFEIGEKVNITVGLDGQGSLMLGLVLFVTTLVIIYSTGYMKGDKDYGRYFASLLLFAASMMGIVISFNLLFTFIFWELVGFSSYLLINHWYEKPGTSDAARKAFIMNRVGDMGFMMGLGLIYSEFGTFEINIIVDSLKSGVFNESVVFWAGFGVFLGCIGKSAQFPLFTWLPDAMKAPTPVSALLHAATMVAAGVFLLARIFPLLHPDLLTIIAYCGAITSFIGAFSAATQTDIKRILAYSTISQLGYMMAALGCHSYIAPLLHLFTHAIFKASLFLCAGAIIHAMSHLKDHIDPASDSHTFDPQDIRLMGGLRKRMPLTFLAFALAAIAGAGIPLSSGFLSKDEILAAVTSWYFSMDSPIHLILPVLVFSTSLMTAFYLGRMFFLIFFGGFRLGKVYADIKGLSKYIHEAPGQMLYSYLPLSVLCLFVFFSINPLDPDQSWLLKYLVHPVSVFREEALFTLKLNHMQEILHNWIISVSVVILTLGFGLSYFLYAFKTKYRKDFLRFHIHLTAPARLSFNAFFIDKFYQWSFVAAFNRLSVFVVAIEEKVINAVIDKTAFFTVIFAHVVSWSDKVFVDGIINVFAGSLNGISNQLRLIQNGKVQTYLVGGIMAFLLAVIWLLM